MMMISLLLRSKSSVTRLYIISIPRYWRLLSTDSNKVDEPLKVEEVETANVPPPATEKVWKSKIQESWANSVIWHQGFGDVYKINGTANINAIRAAAEKGIKRFVYISAADFGVANYLLQGYYKGKKAAKAEVMAQFPYGVGNMKLPISVIGTPLEMILQDAKPLDRIPLIGPHFTPPVNVTSVAKDAVGAATDPVFPPGAFDVYGITSTEVNVLKLRCVISVFHATN